MIRWRQSPSCCASGVITIGGSFVHLFRDYANLVGGAEQKRPMNPEDGDVVRNVLVLQDVQTTVLDIVDGSSETVVVPPRGQ